ncbi:MAG: PQQ-binding-like beta-propeller repeat protein, partial [Proteobacteria bacterium]|nr:PQQ-binding-like beta-propeller repeat protein [Pseudomonadota bacterium]
APVFHQGRLYVPVSSLEEASADPKYPCCTFRGSVVAYESASGRLLWKTHTIDAAPVKVGETEIGTPVLAPSGAAVWNSPTIDARRGLLYVGTGDNYSSPANDRSDAILALDLATGRVRWSWQVFKDDAWNVGCMLKNANCPKPAGPDFDIGAGTMLVRDVEGRDLIVTGLKSGMALAVDADTHDRSLWHRTLGRGSTQGGIQFGMATDGTRVFVPISDIGKKVDPDYPGDPHPGLYALDLRTGELLWSQPAPDRCAGRQFCDPGILAAISASPAAVFAGHLDGMLRAYDVATGRVLWEYDTLQDVKTVSGEVAHGGSMGGGGPVLYHGTLYVASGYGMYFHLPGNVLYAFSVDGR